MKRTLAFAAAIVPLAAPALAASSDWFETEGATVRVVTTGAPEPGKALTGALQIELEQGWKTYWRDPGETGVAPSVTLGGEPVETGFPAPKPLPDNAVGYDQPVSFALTFPAGTPAGPLAVKAFLGLCSTICIPVEASFTLDPADGADDPVDAAAVADAFAALPKPARPGFRASASINGNAITVKAELPPGHGGAGLFLVGGPGADLARPVKVSEAEGEAVFRVEAATSGGAPIRYVLIAGGEAVEGTMTVAAP